METLTLPLLHQSLSLVISDESGVGAARRAASAWADALGFDDTRKGKLALVVTEAASNVFHHARGGEIVLRHLRDAAASGVEILAIDRGPGMQSYAQCAADGYSTRGTAGAGLGSIERNSDVFDVFTAPARGTVLVAQIWRGERTPNASRFGAVCVAISGEDVVGDGYAVLEHAERSCIVLLDGLGHGQGASDATVAGLRMFHAHPSLGPLALLQRIHEALRSTRGAAAALVQIDPAAGRLRFAGVGNCAASIHDPARERAQGLASHNGTAGVGLQLPRVTEYSHAWPADGLLVMHSDGLSARWNLGDYPGLVRRHPSVIAGVLYRDFARRRDDATVLAFTTRSA